MNKLAIASLLLCLAVQSHAADWPILKQGTQEIGVLGAIDFDAADSYQVNLSGNYGYFLSDGWEVGFDADVAASKSYKSGAIGVSTEYNFLNDSNFVPYVGASTQLITANYSGDNELTAKALDSNGLNIKMKLGAKYFVNKNVAFTAEMSHSVSTGNVHISGDELKKSATKLEIGTRFYF